MIKYVIVALILSSFFICFKCIDEPIFDSSITIVNNSSKELLLYYGFSPNSNDTLLGSQNPFLGYDSEKFTINKNSKRKFESDYRSYINNNPTSILTIFLFDKNLVGSSSWEDIRNNYRILKRYQFNKDSLEAKNYNIVIDYP